MEQTCFAVRPGMSERRVAGTLAHAVMDRGATPTVVLIAADERINHYRHPIPKDRKVEKCVMLVVCAKRGGLILSTTRLVHFGDLSADLRRKHDACARIDATFILGSRPGAAVKSIFEAAMQEYALAGFPDEWQLHHQGGATGYSGRDYRATPTIEETVQPNQAFAWNPSITGTKSEDTVIAFESGPEVLSPTPGIPSISVIIGDAAIERSDILVRDG
jgi:antitoxin VapB